MNTGQLSLFLLSIIVIGGFVQPSAIANPTENPNETPLFPPFRVDDFSIDDLENDFDFPIPDNNGDLPEKHPNPKPSDNLFDFNPTVPSPSGENILGEFRTQCHAVRVYQDMNPPHPLMNSRIRMRVRPISNADNCLGMNLDHEASTAGYTTLYSDAQEYSWVHKTILTRAYIAENDNETCSFLEFRSGRLLEQNGSIIEYEQGDCVQQDRPTLREKLTINN